MVRCNVCGKSIIIFCESNGAVHVLDKPHNGFTDVHRCGSYSEMLPDWLVKKLGLEQNGQIE